MNALLHRWPILLLAAILLAAVVLQSSKSGRHARAPRPAPASTTTTIPRVTAPPAATRETHTAQPGVAAAAARAAAARAFARAYLRFLDGETPAAQLPAATARARRQAARGGQIPPRDRAGTLTLAGIQRVARHGQAAGEFVIVAHDHARRSYPAQITLARVNRRWQVTNLVAPELETILTLHPSPPPRSSIRPRPAPPAPSVPTGLRAAAKGFLSAYLPYTYGQLPARRVKNAAPRLLDQLERQPPNVPGAVRSLHPVVRSLSFEPDPAGGWAAVVTVTDGQQSYVLGVQFVRSFSDRRGRWLAIRIHS